MATKKPPHSDTYWHRLAANPATRAAVADKFLNPKDRKTREMNRRLDAPAVAGSTLTNRDVAHQRKAAIQTRYGPQEQAFGQEIASQQTQNTDMAAAYDAYVKELATHQANVKATSDAANAAVSALVGQQAAQGAPKSGTASVDQDAQKASAVRQALIGSFGALTANRGANVTDYADTLAHVVGPGQRLQAGAQGRRALRATEAQRTALKGQEGAYGVQVEGQVRGDESRNVLAAKALGLKESTAQSSADIAKGNLDVAKGNLDIRRGVDPVTGKKIVKPAKPPTPSEASFEDKHGGYSPSEWSKLPRSKQVKILKADKGLGTNPAAVKPKTGLGSIPQSVENTYANEINAAVVWARRLKGQGKTESQIRTILGSGLDAKGSGGTKLKIPSYKPYAVNAALDLAILGHLSPENVKRLNQMGVHVGGRWATKVKTIPFPRV